MRLPLRAAGGAKTTSGTTYYDACPGDSGGPLIYQVSSRPSAQLACQMLLTLRCICLCDTQ